MTQNGILGTIEMDRGGTMSDSRIDLDAIDAAALRDGTIPAQQAHALVAELRHLRARLDALNLRETVPTEPEPEEAGWAPIG